MIGIEDVSFVRWGYSGGERFAEMEVRTSGDDCALIATFRQRPDGTLALVNVSEKREDRELDWFDNNLHMAYPSAMERFSGHPDEDGGGNLPLQAFEQAVLDYKDTRETIEDLFYYGH